MIGIMDDGTDEDENVNTESVPTFFVVLKGFQILTNFLYSHELNKRE